MPRQLPPMPVLKTPSTRLHGTYARIVAQFVVDSLGSPIPCSWRIIEINDEAYAPYAYAAMLSSHFAPGRKGSRPVAVLVQQAFQWGP